MTHAQLALTCAGPVLIEFHTEAKKMLSFKLQNDREQHPTTCRSVLPMHPSVARMMRIFLKFFNDVTSKSSFNSFHSSKAEIRFYGGGDGTVVYSRNSRVWEFHRGVVSVWKFHQPGNGESPEC
jgi:hypothetical protein